MFQTHSFVLLLALLCGFPSRRHCSPINVTLLKPVECKDYTKHSPIPIQIVLVPGPISKEIELPLVDQLNSAAVWIEISLKSSDGIEVWEFDVPPVPRKSLKKHAVCHRGASGFHLENLDPLGSMATGLRKHDSPCESTELGERHVIRGYGETNGVLLDTNVRLGEGFHVIYARVVNGTSGVSLGGASVSISVGSSHDGLRSTGFRDRLSGKYFMVGKEAIDLSETRRIVLNQYKALYEELRDPEHMENFIDPDLWDAIRSKDHAELTRLLRYEAPGVYSVIVFTNEFCEMLKAELDHANNQDLPFTRPNTMNNFGIVLEEIGFKSWLDKFLKIVLNPISEILFPDWEGGALDSTHAFSIRYRLGEDEGLKRHMDLSEVTLNVCLGGDFVGADLYFHGVRDHFDEDRELSVFSHKPGVSVLHVGQQFHGVHQLTKGERQNLVIWGRSSRFRSSSTEIYANSCRKDIIDGARHKAKEKLLQIVSDEL